MCLSQGRNRTTSSCRGQLVNQRLALLLTSVIAAICVHTHEGCPAVSWTPQAKFAPVARERPWFALSEFFLGDSRTGSCKPDSACASFGKHFRITSATCVAFLYRREIVCQMALFLRGYQFSLRLPFGFVSSDISDVLHVLTLSPSGCNFKRLVVISPCV